MTQPPQGPPSGTGYPPPDQGYPPPPDGSYPPAGSGYPPPGGSYPVEPRDAPSYAAGPPPSTPPPPRRSSPLIAPFLAFIALLVVGAASLFLVNYLNSTIDTAAAESSAEPTVATPEAVQPTDEPAPIETPPAPEPSDEMVATDDPIEAVDETLPPEPETTAEPITVAPPSNERQDVAGSILFTRLGGDIWAASGKTLSPLTNSSSTKADSNPTWSPDGKHIYFTRRERKEAKDGRARLDGKYTLWPTDLMRMKASGGDKKKVFKSLINDGRGLWFRHVLQPSVSPAGNNVAVVSDGNDGAADGVELHIVNSKSGRMRKVDVPSETSGVIRLGHNDPDFSADGTKLAFTHNDNAGTEGEPRIGILTCRTKSNCTSGKSKLLKPGYANPSWSPSGTLLAAEATDGKGRDIAIVTAKGGHERVRLTSDGNSFAPEFSPNGDQIAYLKRDGLAIDVRVMSLEIDDKGKITLVDDRPVTSDGAVDGESGVSWHIPRSERSRSVDQAEEAEADASGEPADDLLEGAPPPPPES